MPAMAGRTATARTTTRTEQVYGHLRADILGGRLEPGSRLPFADLVERYGSSMGALREALQRLGEQGLVVNEPQLGFRVASLSIDDLRDLTVARCEIEGLALRHSIAHGDLAWESEIVAAFYALERTPLTVDGDVMLVDWTAAHQRFHEALIAACPNQRLRTIASGLRDAAELYRHWSIRGTVDRDTNAEHQALVDASLARDSDRAVHLLEQHLRTTARLLIDRANGPGDARDR